ncbi:AbrB/MazE/SpoVT family DNA-binding domain-containing protein [Thiothrix subterranea]|uniref:AbrB/MazE/SpoVT family DNA-binding domain-containing protein n=1 Tax=Thiothrix subterranea TaxID=2735563 RepID=UPI00192C3FC8|nr:AbrB/MazE/SpoVT family DNA-binding domain-containing protein [Thiothrix subterranea]QQZ29554.1 AbrB/MazE/SpoVT family DNA-binding domain-containing protein [Thiothrix subterranea]
MHKVSAKRQVTLPKELCDRTGILPGDYVEIFEYNGQLAVIKKCRGASRGSLKHLKPLHPISDAASRQDALDDRR